MRLYRVFPHRTGAAVDEEGGALYTPSQNRGRINNPDVYRVLYAADTAAGAMAEIFNVGDYRQRWTSAMLRPRAGGALSIATLELETNARVFDLDDASNLLRLYLRPSHVVTRDYAVTRAWAKQIYTLRRFAGVRWWSYHDARWGSVGIWRRVAHSVGHLKCVQIEPLTIAYPAIAEAAAVLGIELVTN